jgi:hypothetical protein
VPVEPQAVEGPAVASASTYCHSRRLLARVTKARSWARLCMNAFKQTEAYLYTYDPSGNISLYQSVVRRLGGRDLL